MFTTKYNKILKNKVIGYVASRYLTYILQFINSLFIAAYLGPYYLGIWGFVTLIGQYMGQLNFGISYSVNAIIAVRKEKEWYVQKVIGSSIYMVIGISLLFAIFFITTKICNFNIGDKYDFSKYGFAVLLTGILVYFNNLFGTIFRVYGRLFEIAFNQSLFPVLTLFVIIFYRGNHLLWALVVLNFFATIISFFLFILKSPVKLKPLFIPKLFLFIQKKGWYLYVYNASFYLIVISTRSFVSAYYSVKEFGYFTFAFSLANAVMLLLDSFSFLIYPKILNRFANSSNEKVMHILEALRKSYITTAHLLAHLVLFMCPLFFMFYPKYESSRFVFGLILLTVVLYTNAFGYSGLLIAKGKEKKLSLLSFLSLCINIIATLILVLFVKVPYSYVMLSTMISYCFFVFSLEYYGKKSMEIDDSYLLMLIKAFPMKLFVPYFTSAFLLLLEFKNIYFIIPLLLFVIFNYKSLLDLRFTIKNIISNPNLVNI